MREPRLIRCIRIFRLVESGAVSRVEDLAERLGVCPRTVYRDLCLLNAAGIVLRVDDVTGGLVLAGHHRHEACELTDNDIILLVLAAHLSASSCMPHLSGMIRAAIKRLLSRAPAAVRKSAKLLIDSISLESADNATRDQAPSANDEGTSGLLSGFGLPPNAHIAADKHEEVKRLLLRLLRHLFH